jgi:hypothetical protein
MADNRRQLF